MRFFNLSPRLLFLSELIFVAVAPLILAMSILGLWNWDFSIPLVYAGSDDVWQLVLTKMVRDSGWVLINPFLGAPNVANWHFNAAAQTSSVHSILMLGLAQVMDDAVRIQQTYYVLNFSLIALASYITARALGVSRIFSASMAFLFAFTSFRIGWMFYAYLANYFSVPLALLPVFWITMGKFALPTADGTAFISVVRTTLKLKIFWASVGCIVLVSLSDGYYAFFTLLLLGFATLLRLTAGDWKTPSRLFAPLALIATLFAVTIGMVIPLLSYQHSHQDEFFPGGKQDMSVLKQPFEAEVYSSSLKLLIAPIPEHRIKKVASIGEKLIATSNAARKFPQSKPIVSLGTVGSLLLASALGIVLWLLGRQSTAAPARSTSLPRALSPNPVLWTAIALSLFILLCATSGGIGTLLALVYPTIRAYDRFPIFLIFCLFLGAGSVFTAWSQGLSPRKYVAVALVTVAATAAGMYDQIPFNAEKGSAETKARYLAERGFVNQIETTLGPNALVYQYPHSQYLSDNKYYGWGSFAHIRLYMHSKTIRWSNGASKNSGVENWHESINDEPILRLISDIQGAGFRGMVIDRTVLPDAEYQTLRSTLLSESFEIHEDVESKLAFVKLRDPGFQIFFDAKGIDVQSINITSTDFNAKDLPDAINSRVLSETLKQSDTARPTFLDRTKYPTLFNSTQATSRGAGSSPITPPTDMKGAMTCQIDSGNLSASSDDVVTIELKNNNDFSWSFGKGGFPLSIGFHVQAASVTRWDDGYRIKPQLRLEHGAATKIRVPLKSLDLKTGLVGQTNAELTFSLVQDGNAWFEPIGCKVPVRLNG